MFWRRSRPKEEQVEETDDLAKLQKQFGIKPVSDADVQAEFQSLFGATAAAGGLSPTTEQLLFGAGTDVEDEEEAKILRDLQTNGVDLSDSESEGHQEASDELRGVLEEAHATAKENHAREKAEMAGSAVVPSRSGGEITQHNTGQLPPERAAEVHALKLQAVALKREGKMQEALAKFRDAKQLQEQYSEQANSGARESYPKSVSSTPMRGEMQHYATDSILDEDEVEVTDEDMQDPEFLAQLAKMGLTDNDQDDHKTKSAENEISQQLSAIETEIEQCKVQAVQFKRQNRIADALVCMRKIKVLEEKRSLLSVPVKEPSVQDSEIPGTAETPCCPATVTTSTTVNLNSGLAPSDKRVSGSDDDSVPDVEVTVEDVNDPTLAAKLLALETDNASPTTSQVEVLVPPNAAHISSAASLTQPSSNSRSLINSHSIDEEFLIDAFDKKSDSENESTELPSVLTSTVLEMEGPESPVQYVMTKTTGSYISDLMDQLVKTKQTALSLKRKGDTQAALELMRRAKQIQNLIDRKQQVPENTAVTTTPARDSSNAAKFQEIEQLLVDYGNRAMMLAKENLPINRENALEWLDKRKRYEAEIIKLRQMRQNSLQEAPRYEIVKTSRQVGFELPFIPEDQIRVSIKSVNGLSQVSGRSVFVRFCLSFPSATPHEGQTDIFQVSPNAPFTGEISPEQSGFTFKLPRSRGTMRLFAIKKAIFEVWKPGTLFRNAELVARAYQELTPLLACCEISTHLPFLGSNRKPCGGDIEVALQMRHPLKEKEVRLETIEELIVGEYPEPITLSRDHLPMPTVALEPATDTRSPSSNKNEPNSDTRNAIILESRSPPVSDVLDDPHHIDLIVSYDVINEELGKLEAKMPSVAGDIATELADRYDSLALKKQLLEIEMQTGKLTFNVYVERLHGRISSDRALMAQLLAANRRLDAARVLHRVKIMEKELEGAEGDSEPA